jgi:hypothetical protein
MRPSIILISAIVAVASSTSTHTSHHKRVIVSMGDSSDYDGFLSIIMYKLAACISGSDVVLVMNYPSYLSRFSEDAVPIDFKGFNYGLYQFYREKYGVTLMEVMSPSELIGLLRSSGSHAEFFGLLSNSIAEVYRGRLDERMPTLAIFKDLLTGTAYKLAISAFSETACPAGSKDPNFVFAIGGMNSRTAFTPNTGFVTMADDLFVYREMLPGGPVGMFENIEDVVRRYEGYEAYIDVNGPVSFFTKGMFRNLIVKGLYVMGGVEISESPATLAHPQFVSRLPFATMNQFFSTVPFVNLMLDMSAMGTPIYFITNNEINRAFMYSNIQLWEQVKPFLQNEGLGQVKTGFDAYYGTKEKPVKPFDVLCSLHLIRHLFMETNQDLAHMLFPASETSYLVKETTNVFMDNVYGVTIAGGNNADEARGAMLHYVNEHRNREGALDWKFLEDLIPSEADLVMVQINGLGLGIAMRSAIENWPVAFFGKEHHTVAF